jgi:hypothetical protein
MRKLCIPRSKFMVIRRLNVDTITKILRKYESTNHLRRHNAKYPIANEG